MARGKKLILPTKDRCGNCHAFIGEDAYCRYCGTKRGEGKFLPYLNEEGCVYGPPPIEREHSCPKCGYSWTTHVMIDNQDYCPKCGSMVNTVEKEDY